MVNELLSIHWCFHSWLLHLTSPTGLFSFCVRWHGHLWGWGSYLCKAEELRPVCIHKLPPGFMTRAAAEPVLSVHYHSSIALCLWRLFSWRDLSHALQIFCAFSFTAERREAVSGSANRHQEMTHPDASDGLNPDDSSSVWGVKVYYPPPLSTTALVTFAEWNLSHLLIRDGCANTFTRL